MEPERKPAWSLHRLRAHPRFALYEADVATGLPQDDPRFRCPDITLATRALGWRPEVSWCDGLAEKLAWFAARLEASAGVRA